MQFYKHILHPHPKLPKSISSKYVSIKITQLKLPNAEFLPEILTAVTSMKNEKKKIPHCNSKKKLLVFSYTIELFLYLEKALHRYSTKELLWISENSQHRKTSAVVSCFSNIEALGLQHY